MSTHIIKVEDVESALRLDRFLTTHLPDIPSRSFIQKIIAEGQVTINQKPGKAHTKISLGDEITVILPDIIGHDGKVPAEDISLEIVYEDEFILIINKPEGMLVHPAKGCYSGTVVNALVYHYQNFSQWPDQTRPGIVHRIDRETSGVIVIAKDIKTHGQLARQFKEHTVQKKYVALVEGKVEFDEGIIDVPLGRHPRYFDLRAVCFEDSAKEAKTFYKVLKRFNKSSYVNLSPETGRTHQLRVHMAHLGHPILGDVRYGSKLSFPRLALHAQSLGFIHPKTKNFIEFTVVPPKEFTEYQ